MVGTTLRYIYIYIERERERDRETRGWGDDTLLDTDEEGIPGTDTTLQGGPLPAQMLGSTSPEERKLTEDAQNEHGADNVEKPEQ